MFGMYPKKGTIAVGSDADIVIFDPAARTTMSVDINHMDVDYSAYEGKEIEGSIDLVMARGTVIISDNTYHGCQGRRSVPEANHQPVSDLNMRDREE